MTIEDFTKQEPKLAAHLQWFLNKADVVYDVCFQNGRWEATVGIERVEFEIDTAYTGPCQAIGQECDRVWHWEPCRTNHWTSESGRFCPLRE